MAGRGSETRGLKLALAAYVFLVVLDLSLYFITGLLVLLAVAFEALSSLLIAAVLLHAAVISRRPPDEAHMYGYGRAQYVAAVVAAVVFIAFMAVEVLRQAVPRFFQPPEAGGADPAIAMAAITVSMLVLLVPVIAISRVKAKNAAQKSQLVSSLEDETAFAAGLAGTFLVSRGFYLADPVSSIVVAGFIIAGGVFLIRDNAPYLLGKAPPPELIAQIIETARSVPGVLGVHGLRAEYTGHQSFHSGFHIEVAAGTPVEAADRIAHEVEERVGRATGCRDCVIHVDPAG